mgnify:CR=1 FL=1
MLEYCFKDNHTSPITDANTGEVFCSDCGTVLIEKTVDRSNGLAAHTKEDYMTKAQNGPPSKIAISDMSKSSVISNKNYDSGGTKLRASNRNHF